MDTQSSFLDKNVFDLESVEINPEKALESAQYIGETILKISKLVIDFSDIQRAPRYCEKRRENDVEHSFMLALAGIEISRQERPDLDNGLVGKLALVHDLIEVKTGDMPTFNVTEEQLAQKHLREQTELPALLKELPPYIAELLESYEKQDTPEALFVKNVDKLLPYSVDIQGAGVKVMNEDFGVYTRETFFEHDAVLEQRWRVKFPDPLHEPLHLAHNWLARKFAPILPLS